MFHIIIEISSLNQKSISSFNIWSSNNNLILHLRSWWKWYHIWAYCILIKWTTLSLNCYRSPTVWRSYKKTSSTKSLERTSPILQKLKQFYILWTYIISFARSFRAAIARCVISWWAKIHLWINTFSFAWCGHWNLFYFRTYRLQASWLIYNIYSCIIL